MRPHQRFPVEDQSQIGEVRRAGQMLATAQGFDEEAAGRLAIALTELATNLVRHVGPERQAAVLMAPVERGIEVLSLDRGPGMDLARCLQDGFSSGGTSGTGLGALRRLAERFEGFSAPGHGTVLAATFGRALQRPSHVRPPPPVLQVGGLTLAAPGETVSGDAWTVVQEDERWWIVVADGLGHGPDAAAAADRMITLVPGVRGGSPAALLERAHEAMRSTRGAAVAAACLSPEPGPLLFAGAGNITGRLMSGVEDRTLLSQHGTLGLQIRRLQDASYAWPEHGILVMHSDGVATRWSLKEPPGLLRADPTVIAAWILRDHLRGRDDATVVVARRQ